MHTSIAYIQIISLVHGRLHEIWGLRVSAELYERAPYIHINMWAVGAQVHFSWLPRLLPVFASLPRHLHTHRIRNRFHIIMLDSYCRCHPARPFRVVALVSYCPFWIVAISPVSCCRTRCRLTRFGSPPSHLFRVVMYHQFWIVTLLWQIRWATRKLLSNTLVTCFLLGEIGTSRRQSRCASLLR